MEALIILLALCAGVIGIIGSVVPGIPGPPTPAFAPAVVVIASAKDSVLILFVCQLIYGDRFL